MQSDENKIEATAHHEAAHAIVALCFGWPVLSVTIVPNEAEHKAGGIHLVNGDAPEASDPIGTIAFLAAGYCGEVIHAREGVKSVSGHFWKLGGQADRFEAYRVAGKHLGCQGLKGPKIAKAIAVCVFEFIQEGAARRAVDAVANGLLMNETILQDGVEAIWRSCTVPPDEVAMFRGKLRVACEPFREQ